MPVDDLARSDVVTATEETPVSELGQTMADETVGSVVIVDDEMPVGIVTDRDLALRCVAEESEMSDKTAENVMTEDLETIDRTAGFYEAVDRMSDNGIRRLPVTDDSGELVGILTSDDLTTLLADEQQGLSSVIEAQRAPYDE
ncbi:CBS domain-containing protein [Halohasta litorea]|uniref:CBS domain-containing protein n=1 Tax=Halohasta litorea TaxID=869891 RepID=A0ABD6D5N2_9EURY|nr:CBS domain-containing protein [Halohasta litorea]